MAAAETGEDLQKRKKKCKKKIVEEGSALPDSEGLKKGKHSEVRCSPYFQKKPQVNGDGGEEKKEEEEDSNSQLYSKFEQMLSRYAYNSSCDSFRRPTTKSMAHSQVRKVSPYFQSSTPPQLKPFSKLENKVSPYFHKQQEIETVTETGLQLSIESGKLEMEEREAEIGEDLQKRKKKSKKKKAEEGSALPDSEGLKLKKKRKHSEDRCSPYFQKKPSVTVDGGQNSEEKKRNKKIMLEEEKKSLISVKVDVNESNEKKKKIMMLVEEEEEEKKMPKPQFFAKIEQVASRHGYKNNCDILRRNVKTPTLYNDDRNNTTESMAHFQVRNISPYFKNSTPQLKPCSKLHKKVSPHFHKLEEIETETDTGRPFQVKKKPSSKAAMLTAAQKRDKAYERKRPDNTWNPPMSPVALLQHDHVHDPWRVLVICMLLNRTTGKQTSLSECSDSMSIR